MKGAYIKQEDSELKSAYNDAGLVYTWKKTDFDQYLSRRINMKTYNKITRNIGLQISSNAWVSIEDGTYKSDGVEKELVELYVKSLNPSRCICIPELKLVS